MPQCSNSWCKSTFELFPEDRELFRQFDVPEPTMCPDCRHQRRAAFQISLVLFERKSALSGEPILTLYRPNKPYAVYSIDEWWSDAWDPLSYGREYDFSRPFFEQFAALFSAVPKMATFNEGCENCEYCASAGSAKDCYYCRTVHRSQNCYFSEMVTGYNENLCDCLRCQRSGKLYECILCINCHQSAYLLRCTQTHDSYFSTDLRGCSNCLFCHNLRNKSYYVENKPVSKEEFKARKAELQDGCHSTLEKNLKKFGEVYSATIWQDLTNTNCENCVGDGLVNSADCYQCFNCFNCQNARYCWMLTPSERCVSAVDITRGGIGELLYNCTGLGGGNYFMRMCSQCRKCSEMTYCIDCYHSKNCFGCAGMKSGNHCILNKQYTEEEYEDLVPRIIAQMQKTPLRSFGATEGQTPLRSPSGSFAGYEWGIFFPPSIAPFPYNDSLGQVYFPLSKKDAETRGFQWEEPLEQKLKGNTRREPLPDCIDDIEDAICHEVLTCETSGKQYKIIRQELAFYRSARSPLPRKHPDVRMQRRSNMLSAHKLWNRTCGKCGKDIQTTFAPDRPETVYCEECYLAEVY